MAKRADCKKAVIQLVAQWASIKGIKRGQPELPSFIEFTAWLRQEGYSQYLEFRSIAGPYYDAEQWFDQELEQGWRN